MSFYQAFVDFLGTPPEGWEPMVYVLSGILVFYMISSIFAMLVSMVRRR